MWILTTTRYSVIFQKKSSRVRVAPKIPSSVRVAGTRWGLVTSKGWKSSARPHTFRMRNLRGSIRIGSKKRNTVQAWKTYSYVWKICWKGIWGGTERLELQVRVWEPSVHSRASSWLWVHPFQSLKPQHGLKDQQAECKSSNCMSSGPL